MGIRLKDITDFTAGLANSANEFLVNTSGNLTRLVPWSTFADWVLKTYEGFVQSGSGATATTAQEELRRISVRPEQFGAEGDGTTDDATAFQAAIDKITTGTVGVVVLTPGKTYRLDTPVTNGGVDNRQVSFSGYGAGIKFTGTGVLRIRNSHVSVEGIKFTQDSAITKSKSIYAVDILDVHNVTVRDCYFESLRYTAIQVRASGASSAPYNINIDSCRFYRCSSGDIVFQGFDASHTVKYVTVSNCKAEGPSDPLGSGNTQIRFVHVLPYCAFVTISDCHSYGTANAGYTAGWRDAVMIGNSTNTGKPTDIIVANCSLSGMGDDCVGISGATRVTVTGCILYDSPVTSGVYVPGDGTFSNDQVTITDNIIYGHTLAGIFLKDTLHYTVTGNFIDDCDEGVICVDNSVGVLGGSISHNRLTNIAHTAISALGSDGVMVNGNFIDTFGESASGTTTDKEAILVKAKGSYCNNIINDGAIAFLINGAPNDFIISGNVGTGITDTFYFLSFTGDRFVISGNSIAQSGSTIVNGPGQSATKAWYNNVDYHTSLQGTATFNPASLVDGAGETTTVTVTGAALGDFAVPSFSRDLQGITLTAWVSAANTVSVRFQNETGGTLDLASGTLRARVEQAIV